MKRFTSDTQKTGAHGESICVLWLKNNGFKVLERNYTTFSGELDIVATKNGILHFIEVKSIQINSADTVSHETTYNPADNLTSSKIRKCYSVISKYLRECKVSRETKFQFDLYMVYIDRENIKHRIKRIENVVFNT